MYLEEGISRHQEFVCRNIKGNQKRPKYKTKRKSKFHQFGLCFFFLLLWLITLMAFALEEKLRQNPEAKRRHVMGGTLLM